MVGMEITHTNTYAADPATVARMMTDETFLKRVCEASGATSYDVTVEGNHIRRTRVMPAPPAAAKYVKGDVTVVEELQWDEPAADGTRTGTMTGSAQGLSFLDVHGNARIAPGGKGTDVVYRGELKINIPFLGKKLEQQAAPFLVEAMALEQGVGEQWLAEHQ